MDEELEQLQAIYDTAAQFLVESSFQILTALIILAIGMLIARKVGNLVESLMVSRQLDITLSRFTGNTVQMILVVMVGVIALDQMGISITPLIAAVGALSLGAGLAIQGMLANYAAGFTIIITRPFVVGDTISVQGVTGLVESVHLPYTILINEDDVRIQMPNRLVVGEILHNSKGEKLVELSIGVAYASDPDQVIQVIRSALEQVDQINPERGPLIGIEQFADSSINFGVRFWVPTDQYFDRMYAANLAIHRALKEAGIQIPFPQREVRMLAGE